jgi:hypothetical protein
MVAVRLLRHQRRMQSLHNQLFQVRHEPRLLKQVFRPLWLPLLLVPAELLRHIA